MFDRLDVLLARVVARLPQSALDKQFVSSSVDPAGWVPDNVELVMILEWTSHFLSESSNRHAYNSCELLAGLLSHPSDQVVMASLYTLLQATRRISLCGRHHRCSSGVSGSPIIQQRLWQMVQAHHCSSIPSLRFQVLVHAFVGPS